MGVGGTLLYETKSRNREQIGLLARFLAPGAAPIDAKQVFGSGITFARTGVGLFTATFDKSYYKLLKCDITVNHASVVYHGRVTGEVLDASGAITGVTFVIYTAANPGVAVDPLVAASTWANMDAVFLNSRVR